MFTDLFARLGFGREPEPEPDDAHAPERFTIHGLPVEVFNTRPDIATADVIARLTESLELIASHQPWRWRHLVRDVRAIRVERYACRGAFIPSERTIMTELTFLARRDITAAPVASSILHEGVHARVHVMSEALGQWTGSGVQERDAGNRDAGNRDAAREERLCRRAELAFGAALPAELGAPVVERALASLELDDVGVAPRVDWHEAQRRIAEVDGRAE